ncbi:hypothetical protein [Sinomonas terricola]|nr:hypothetical protein [Sinomonas sp. JGH33]
METAVQADANRSSDRVHERLESGARGDAGRWRRDGTAAAAQS